MSKVKNTLVSILQKEIEELHPKVIEMDEQCILKQVAKNKVLYNLTQKQNALELVYSYLALAEYYIANQLYSPALKALTQTQFIKETGDASYQMGVCLFNSKQKREAYRMFDSCLKQEWIQPSLIHQQSNQLECISYMQKIQYETALKHPQNKRQFQQKLVNLSHEKIKLVKKYDQINKKNKDDSYYYSLTMGDLAQIYLKFEEYETAYQKIKTSIQMMKGENENVEKLIQLYFISATIAQKLKLKIEVLNNLKNAISLIENNHKIKQMLKFSKMYQDIYYLYIKNTLEV